MTTLSRPQKFTLESLYLPIPASLGEDGPPAHGVKLGLTGRAGSSNLVGTLQLDPNACTLNSFGDREMCTKIAIRSTSVTATLMPVPDPKGLHRSYYMLQGEHLAPLTALIVDPQHQRHYLKCNDTIVALFPDDGA
ncbi:hypothetical protein [Nannocystis sp.]|uniref:hypothetical protein n=1 Tax=Nannocystis sp. TaxID=1962667 RepID=UPI0024275701|nr:hypothetical protein [Nannocystis sp.]MBK7826774.1 hypothetical protein [Nannocystis sp.]MBK9754395.1 hypothetical protein [Nannocystis sp.]